MSADSSARIGRRTHSDKKCDKGGSHMKMYLISDNVDTYTGMRLAGVDGIVVHERDELKKANNSAE